jgi:hypothetical protein
VVRSTLENFINSIMGIPRLGGTASAAAGVGMGTGNSPATINSTAISEDVVQNARRVRHEYFRSAARTHNGSLLTALVWYQQLGCIRVLWCPGYTASIMLWNWEVNS